MRSARGFQDFSTGSWALFQSDPFKILSLNVAPYDAEKRGALPLVSDARVGLQALSQALGGWRADASVAERARAEKTKWLDAADAVLAATNAETPSDAQVIGAVARTLGAKNTIVVGAAGGLPGELHKLWAAAAPGAYHLEYGFSCMGYEIAGGSASRWRGPTARSSSWSATART